MRIYEYNLFFGNGLGFMKEIIDRAMFRNFIEGVFANDMNTSHCFSCRPFRIYSTRPVFKEFEGETHIKLDIYIGDYSIYGGFIKKSALNDEKEFDEFYHFMIDQMCYVIDRNKEIFDQLNSEDVSYSMHRVIKLKNANRCLYDKISAEVDKIKKRKSV